MKNWNVADYCQIGLLTALISVTGAFKLPSIIPGLDFQLSAPIAIAICVAFGFKKYIVSGILSSIIGLILGTQNPLSVAIAMQFRIIVGIILYAAQNRLWSIVICGPIASTVARLTLSVFFGKAFTLTILMAALPGFIFTAITAPIFAAILKRIRIKAVRHAV